MGAHASVIMPREEQACVALATGAAKTASAAARMAGFSTSASIRNRLTQGDLRAHVIKLANKHKLTLSRLLRENSKLIDAQKIHVTKDGDTIKARDNDASLRAIEMGYRIHGAYAAGEGSNGHGNSITVNIMTVDAMRAMRNPAIALPASEHDSSL